MESTIEKPSAACGAGKIYTAYVPYKPGYEAVKRAADIIISVCAIVILMPLMLLTAAAIKLEDGGTVVFRQTRMTKNGKIFTMYKFRSMSEDAETKLSSMLGKNEMSGPAFKIKDDNRITRVGKFIRHTSIDELPQLYNVLIGDISIIGPRPPLPREVEQYSEYQMHRLDVKTGLACYREVMGRNNITRFDDWVELDLKYIRERGVLTDLRIFFLMIKAVLTCEGAE